MLLQAADLAKSYAGVHALRSVSFSLNPGEIHALVGENGAGKSTLIKILTGAVQPDSGTIRLHNRPILHNSPNVARSLGISAIYQQPALFPHLTVAENIALATEPQTLFRRVNWRARRDSCRALLARVGSAIHPDTPAAGLSMPEQQIVEIAKALGTQAKVLILDEPTASLSGQEVQNLFRILADLRAQGVGIIYISHRLEELLAIADRVTVLRDGQVIATKPMAGVTPAELIQLMVGRELTSIYPKPQLTPGEPALCLAGPIQLTLHAGEIVGLAGLAGAGRTELAESIAGLRPAHPDQKIRLHGNRTQIAYLPEDRRRHGVILEMPIAANITLAILPTLTRRGLLDFPRERALAANYKTRLAIKTPNTETRADALSGGNQQKVALARWLATHPDVLILDEPTQGVDVGAKAEIHRIIGDLAAQGLAILLISSELPEILGMSDRIAVMRAGRIEAILPRAEATQQRILELALGNAA